MTFLPLDYLLIFAAFATSAAAILNSTFDENGSLNLKGYILFFTAFLTAACTCFFLKHKNVLKNEQQNKIQLLESEIKNTRDVFSQLDSSVIHEEKLLFTSEEIKLAEFEVSKISFPLSVGMYVKTPEGNCHEKLTLWCNNKDKEFKEKRLIQIKNEDTAIKAFLQNRGKEICKFQYEIWGTTEQYLNALRLNKVRQNIAKSKQNTPKEAAISTNLAKTDTVNKTNEKAILVSNLGPVKEKHERIYVSVGCYGSSKKDKKVRRYYKLPTSTKLKKIKTGNCYRYVLDTNNLTLSEAKAMRNKILKVNDDCAVMKFSFSADGKLDKWESIN